jgi:hypothetical protein
MSAFSLCLGVLVFAAFAIGGNAGWAQLARLMAGLALLFVVNNRSETLSGSSGPGRDERWATIDLHCARALSRAAW